VISDNPTAFRATFVEMWFERYDRAESGSARGSRSVETYSDQIRD
jgi:hypothetical protein